MIHNVVIDLPFMDKERPASKFLVSAHGRATLPSVSPDLNIGMDPWSTSPCSLGQGEVNSVACSQSNAPLSQMVWFSFMKYSFERKILLLPASALS